MSMLLLNPRFDNYKKMLLPIFINLFKIFKQVLSFFKLKFFIFGGIRIWILYRNVVVNAEESKKDTKW